MNGVDLQRCTQRLRAEARTQAKRSVLLRKQPAATAGTAAECLRAAREGSQDQHEATAWRRLSSGAQGARRPATPR